MAVTAGTVKDAVHACQSPVPMMRAQSEDRRVGHKNESKDQETRSGEFLPVPLISTRWALHTQRGSATDFLPVREGMSLRYAFLIFGEGEPISDASCHDPPVPLTRLNSHPAPHGFDVVLVLQCSNIGAGLCFSPTPPNSARMDTN